MPLRGLRTTPGFISTFAPITEGVANWCWLPRPWRRGPLQGELDPSSIDENTLAAELFTAGEQDPDLLIRTSGERRISNFLLWQLAYAEIHVTDVFWPDFNREALLEALLDYQGRSRRFGGLDDLRAGALGS